MSLFPEKKERASGGILPYALFLVTGMMLLLLSGHSSAPRANWESWGRQGKQYEELTEAVFSGQLSLKEEPAAFLAEMDNPYDPRAREAAAREHDAYYLNDVAYYNGKYYTYFGLTPALLFFFPVRLLTGKILPSWVAVHVSALLCVPAALFFVCGLRRRYAKAAGKGTVAVLSGLLLSVTGLPYLTAFCTTYSLTAVAGLMTVTAGLGCFLFAEEEDGTLRRGRLIAGSVLCALSVGCRALFAISFLLLFPLFWDAIRRGAFFRREKEAATNTACVLLPALFIAAVLLAYNAMRFGNPFEFGFRYLLTTRDMMHGEKTFGEVMRSMFLLGFQGMHVDGVFPFLHTIELSRAERGNLFVEPMFGGFFGMHPLLLIVLLAGGGYFVWRAVQKKQVSVALKTAGDENHAGDQTEKIPAAQERPSRKEMSAGLVGFCLTAVALGMIILLTDAILAGVSQRYESDFALFFFIPFAGIVLRLMQAGFVLAEGAARGSMPANKKRLTARILPAALGILLALELLLSAGTVLCDGRYYAMEQTNPAVYERIASWFSP